MNYMEEKTVEYCENDVKLTYEIYKCGKKHKIKIIFLRILWWIWQLTWGALMTIPGLLITAFCIVFLKGKPHKNGFSYIVEIGGNWGGLELGAVALCGCYKETDPEWYEQMRRHEFGHNIQQLIFGPFQLFIVFIPSSIRYWYQRIMIEKYKKDFPADWYDSIWFEGTATKWGTYFINLIESPIKYEITQEEREKFFEDSMENNR